MSVVVPLYDEEDNVSRLHDALRQALDHDDRRYEFLFVDDGSRDSTLARAIACSQRDSRVVVVQFQRNFGQTAAMAAGIDHAIGRIIVTMDGDLQNDPQDIPRLLDLIDAGYDLATGWRRRRQDDKMRVLISKIANRIINGVLGVDVRDSGCSLKTYRREIIQALPLHGEMHRFIPALSQLAGARVAQIEVRHHSRQFGVSKYGFSRIYKVMLDILSIYCLLRFARKPFTWLAWPIALSLLAGLADILYIGFDHPQPSVPWSIALLAFNLAGFFVIWSLAGYFFAVSEPRVSAFSSVSAKPLEPISMGFVQ
ncbi:glycosyltransferase [Sphingomonas koreensis]|nr:glycosyltransferase [Sphingomonas koreensis]